uniref:Uncharacterized protein n=1 Tax=Anguilla anguilla TaxID=7936 RepID=A0A0E9T8B6_ANGAN
MRLVLPILYHSQHFLIWYGYSEKSTQCSEHPVLLWDPVRKQICLKECLWADSFCCGLIMAL